jgi:hypothetical protein
MPSIGFLTGDCLPRNLTLNFIGGAVRSSRLSSLCRGIFARVLLVPCLGNTQWSLGQVLWFLASSVESVVMVF